MRTIVAELEQRDGTGRDRRLGGEVLNDEVLTLGEVARECRQGQLVVHALGRSLSVSAGCCVATVLECVRW